MAQFLKFKVSENTALNNICKGTYRVEGLIKEQVKIYEAGKMQKQKTIKRWVNVTLSQRLTKQQARKIADDMNEDINNINASSADKILEHESSELVKELNENK